MALACAAPKRHRTPRQLLDLLPPCAAAPQLACLACSADALTVGGQCLPGLYKLAYSATNANGATAAAERTVLVYRQGTVVATFALRSALVNATAAAEVADALRDPAGAAFAEAVAAIQARLGSAGNAVDASDIDITHAEVRFQQWAAWSNGLAHALP